MDNIWEQIKNFFTLNLNNIILFFCVAIFGLIILKIVLTVVRRIFKKTKLDRTLTGFIVSLLKFVLLMVYILTLATIVGIPVTSIVAIFTALSLAVALAIQGSFSNLANGMVLLASKPFKAGDYIEIAGVAGTVNNIKLMNTELTTANNQVVTIPHNKTIADIITNYTVLGKRRMEIVVSVDYNVDIEFAKKVIMDVCLKHDKILKQEINSVRLSKCSASSLDFTLKAWAEIEDYWSTYYDISEAIVIALRKNKITIPYQTIDVHIKEKK